MYSSGLRVSEVVHLHYDDISLYCTIDNSCVQNHKAELDGDKFCSKKLTSQSIGTNVVVLKIVLFPKFPVRYLDIPVLNSVL